MTCWTDVDWTMKKMFGRMLTTSCPLATTSAIYVDAGPNMVRSITQQLCTFKKKYKLIKKIILYNYLITPKDCLKEFLGVVV